MPLSGYCFSIAAHRSFIQARECIVTKNLLTLFHCDRINPSGSEAAQGGGQSGAPSARQRNFQFDQVFSGQRRQNEVYEGLGISKLINRVVDVSINRPLSLTGLK